MSRALHHTISGAQIVGPRVCMTAIEKRMYLEGAREQFQTIISHLRDENHLTYDQYVALLRDSRGF